MPTYSETLDYIFNLRGGEVDLRLHRVSRALALLDHPERRFPAFHIAGTNGKGSTAAVLHRILTTQGYKAGLYTSPHLVSFTERIRVGDQEISPNEVVHLTQTLKDALGEAGISLTFFEFVTVMALTYFSRAGVDVAVIEVGMGGRLDATNLVLPAVSIITTIARDHEAFLGTEIESIAREKAGIIKNGVPLVCGLLPPEADGVVDSIARSKYAGRRVFGRDFSISLGEDKLFTYKGLEWDIPDLYLALRGDYQKTNAAVALAALETVHDAFPVTEVAVRDGLKTVSWPGRFEVVLKSPTVFLDGGHNIQGITALVREMRRLLQGQRVKVLFGAMSDKQWDQMLQELSGIASEIILTRVPMERSADPIMLRKAVSPGVRVRILDDPLEAVRALVGSAEAGETALVTGSLYLIGRVRPFLSRMKDAETLGVRV
ncbi:MAG: bifunctional folylpolyglutamate synthase/dihydrofolate synthase [Deltaproteobacteria bacterium]|nr:bifunctional folylpolyglutamate synthase/dihydrofolate synthase [Deltaproteobacteria bacterium]